MKANLSTDSVMDMGGLKCPAAARMRANGCMGKGMVEVLKLYCTHCRIEKSLIQARIRHFCKNNLSGEMKSKTGYSYEGNWHDNFILGSGTLCTPPPLTGHMNLKGPIPKKYKEGNRIVRKDWSSHSSALCMNRNTRCLMDGPCFCLLK